MVENDRTSFFQEAFYRLSSNRTPYPWQLQLFLDLTSGAWPRQVPLPTGTGKTAVLQIWLLALAWSLRQGAGGIPRRLAWVVNRRVVVDQVTKEAEALLERLKAWPELHDCLQRESSSGQALAISTLRGQFADNGDWARDPSTPAVVIGTVDMIGSRLLFRGYRSGPYHRPIHAGLLGVDTLIVNDEAHLSHAFARLLTEIHRRAPTAYLEGKSFHTMLLSATLDPNKAKPWNHSINEDLAESERFRTTFNAPKSLNLHESESKVIQATFSRLATENPARRTLVFIEQPEKAADFAEHLAKEGRGVELLTGTMRGLERDALASSRNFKKFLDENAPAEPVWLVATSAAEVGVNLTCEKLITGLVEADRLVQRFGRLNRFGGTFGEAHVIYATPKEQRHIETLKYLQSLHGDVSCRNIWEHQPPPEACSDRPLLARLEDRLIETWALTSYRDRELRRPVGPWLHGKEDGDPPEAEVAWRSDVEILVEWAIDEEQIERIFERYSIRPHERLREPAKRIFEKLAELAKEKGEEAARTGLIRIYADGSAEVVRLNALKREEDLYGSTLVLPDKLGRLARGMFRPVLALEDNGTLDIADNPEYSPERCRILFKDGNWTSPCLGAVPEIADIARYAKENGYRAPLVVRKPESDDFIAYFVRYTKKGNPLSDVLLKKHRSDVAAQAHQMAERVGLKDLAEKFRKAGELHDDGKARRTWQRAFGGSETEPIAKSKAPPNTRLLAGYRHELGSLVDAKEDDDLILHLIASHHAAARPFFTDRQLDRENIRKSQDAAIESARRFARLQQRYGPWGLAYLEAVFKCADGLVSAEEGGGASE